MLPEAQVKRLRETLIGFRPMRDIGAPRVGSVLGISGFARFDDAEFKTIREAARIEGILSSEE